MSFFPKPTRPSRAIADLIGFVRNVGRKEIVFGLLSIVITGLWFWAIFDKLSPKREWKPPQVFYVKQWSAARTAAEVRAQQAIDAPREQAERARVEAEAAARRAQYQRLAKQLGI